MGSTLSLKGALWGTLEFRKEGTGKFKGGHARFRRGHAKFRGGYTLKGRQKRRGRTELASIRFNAI